MQAVKEKEVLEEKVRRYSHAIKMQDAAIKGLVDKVTQLESGHRPAAPKISKKESKLLSRGEREKLKKRELKEAAKDVPSTITFIYPDPCAEKKTFVGDEIRLDTEVFEKYKEKHLNEEIKNAHIERLAAKGMNYNPQPVPEPELNVQDWSKKPSKRQKKLRNAKNRAFRDRELINKKRNREWEKDRGLSLTKERYIDAQWYLASVAIKSTLIDEYEIPDNII